MITSIVLTGEYSIGIDKNDRFQVGDKKISLKEVPFVRYRFDNYNQDTVDYINKMKRIFKYSAHMAEINVKNNVREVVDLISDGVNNIIIFLYVDIDDDDVIKGLSEQKISDINTCEGAMFDRIMLRDKSTTLDLVHANMLKKQISEIIGIEQQEIGICQSPLSFNGEACLTAVLARQLSATYSENDECALPSANHECMKTCGCIRYIKINNNIIAPIVTSKISTSGGTKKSTSKTNVTKGAIPKLGRKIRA